MTRGPSPKTAAILQPFEAESYLSVNTCTCFDEFIDMQQGTRFQRKGSEPQQLLAPNDKDKLILEHLLIRFLNIVDLRTTNPTSKAA